MNIFATYPCPYKSAKFLDNKRQNKMILESCQILSTALHLHNHSAPYKPTHIHHPVIQRFTKLNKANYTWVLRHLIALLQAYNLRTGKVHACSKIAVKLAFKRHLMPAGELTQFVNCARNKEKGVDFTHVEDTHKALGYIYEIDGLGISLSRGGNKMKKYQVFIPIYAEVNVTVDAENKEEAVNKAFENMTRTVCCYCSEHVELGEYRDDEKPHVEEQ